MKHVFCSNGSWIDVNNWVLNRSWIYDTYFSLYRAIHPREKSGGNARRKVSGYNVMQRSFDRSFTEVQRESL